MPAAEMSRADGHGRLQSFLGILRRIGYRLLRLSGEFTAIVLGLVFVWFYGLNVLLVQKTVDVSFLKPNTSLWFSKAFDGKAADLEALRLSWRPELQAIVLEAEGIAVVDDANTPLQNLEHVSIAFDYEDALRGISTPRHVNITGGTVTWLKDENGNVTAGLGTPDTVGRFGALPQQNADVGMETVPRRFDMATLESVTIKNAAVYLMDRTRDVDLHFQDTDVLLKQVSEMFHMQFDTVVETRDDTGEISSKAVFSQDFEDFDLSVNVEGINPHSFAPREGFAANIGRLDVPVNAALKIAATRDAGLQVVSLDLTSGSGTGGFSPQGNRIDGIVIAANYDPQTEALNIETFDVAGDRFGGRGQAKLENIGRPATGFFRNDIRFLVGFEDLKLDATRQFDDMFRFDGVNMEGRYDPASGSLDLNELRLKFPTYTLNANVALSRTTDGKPSGLSGGAKVTGDMTPEDLLHIWPTEFATGARRWIKRAIKGGLISDLDLNFDIPPSVFQSERIKDEDLTLGFNVREGHVKYISTMTPYTNVTGRGVLRGNSLEFEAFSGNIGDLTVTRGQVNIPRLFPKGGDLIIDVQGSGQAEEMLTLIDQKPFMFTSQYGLNPADFDGQGQVSLNIKRPLLEFFDRSLILYEIEGDFTGVKVPFSMGRHGLEEGDFNLKADGSGIIVKGPVNFGPWRTDLEWKETFGEDGVPTRYRLAGQMDGNTLDGFGFGFREYVGGSATVILDAEGRGLSITGADFSVDLKQADIRAGEYWSKPIGAPGTITGNLSRSADGAVSISNVDVKASGLSVQGEALFAEDARLINFELDQVAIEAFAEGRVKVAPNADNTAFNIDMSGTYLDISPIVGRTIRANTGQMALPMNLRAKVDRLALDEAFILKDAAMEIRHNGIGTQAARITGAMTDGEFTASLSPSSADKGRKLLIEIPDASLALKAFLNLESIHGGALSLSASLPEVGVEGPLSGDITVTDFALVNAPVMAQILSLASLRGLTDAMGGEGLTFTRFETPFSYNEGAVSVRDARASGPALGLTGSGEIDFAGKTVDMDGVLVPAYSANSALSAIPVIGDIFVGKKGEGIFALSYAVKGPFSKTQVGVNPLSALTPGFLRRIFDTGREDLPQTSNDVPNPDEER